MPNIVAVILFCAAIGGQPTVPCGALELEQTFSTTTGCALAVGNEQKDENTAQVFRLKIAEAAGMPEGTVWTGDVVSKSFCVEEDYLKDFYKSVGVEYPEEA